MFGFSGKIMMVRSQISFL